MENALAKLIYHMTSATVNKSTTPLQYPVPLKLQWNLRIKDTLGPAILSSVERLSSSRRLKMNYCYGKGVQNCILCWEGLYRRFHCNHTFLEDLLCSFLRFRSHQMDWYRQGSQWFQSISLSPSLAPLNPTPPLSYPSGRALNPWRSTTGSQTIRAPYVKFTRR